MTNSTENSTPSKSPESRNSDSLIQVQTNSALMRLNHAMAEEKLSFFFLETLKRQNVQPSLLHLERHFSNLNTQSTILFSSSLLPRSVEKRPMRLRLEIEIK